MHGSTFVADLAVVLSVAALTAILARKLRQPTVLGYLFAGLVVGPYLRLPVFADAERVGALAEFGVVLVMFAIGLEFRFAKLMRVLPTSGFTAIVQVGFLGWCGVSAGRLLGWGPVEASFLGASVAISSTMIVSKVFEQVKVTNDVREHVLGVLVVQDLAAIILIAAMTAVAAGGGLGPTELLSTLARLGAVLFALTAGGLFVVPRLVRLVVRQRSRELLAVVAVGICFGLALLAQMLGYSVALGAFLAGMLVAESRASHRIEPLLQPMRDVFAAVFFVSIGMGVDPREALHHLPASLLITAVVIVGQLVSITAASALSGLGIRRGVSAGLALGQIGEFAFIIGAIGVDAGVARPELLSILVSVAVLTAFTTPLCLRATPRIVELVDRLLPGRLQHLLAAHGAWLDRFRTAESPAVRSSLERRAFRALALDALALFVLLTMSTAWMPEVIAWMQGRFGLSAVAARSAGGAAVVLVGVPILIGLTRNALALANRLGASVLARYAAPSPAALLAAHTSRLLVFIGVLLAVGVPAIALLRPRLGGVWGMVLLLLALLAASWHVWRNAGALEAEVRSGAEELAEIFANQAAPPGAARHLAAAEVHAAGPGGAQPGERPGERPGEAGLFSGLDTACTPPLSADCVAAGRTLAELGLRARTGASAIAILRGRERVLLPRGTERLAPGDVVALMGSREALGRARDVLALPLDAALGRPAP